MFVITKGTGKYFAKVGDGPVCWVPDTKRANVFETAASADYSISKYGGVVLEV